MTDHSPLIWFQNSKDPCSRVSRWRLKLAEYDFDVIYKAGKMNVNVDALSRNPIDNNKKKSRYLQVDENYTFMTAQEKMFSQKTSTRNKQENSENKIKLLKRRNLNPANIPDDVHRLSEISEAQILNIDSKIPEFFQEFLSEESLSEIGKNNFKIHKFIQKYGFKIYFYDNIFIESSVFQKMRKFIMENYYYKSSKETTTRKSKKFESK